jgi:uncharacterized protein (UPF0335 family)
MQKRKKARRNEERQLMNKINKIDKERNEVSKRTEEIYMELK